MSTLSRIVVFTCCVFALVACGGGGGGGSSSPPPRPSGDFTVSDTSVSLTALQGPSAPSATKDIALTVTAPTGVAVVGAAFPASEGVPGWLNVVILGAMPNFTVRLVPSTSATAGRFTATLLLGTADESSNILKSVAIPVTYDVVPGIFHRGSATTSLDFVLGHSDATKPLSLDIVGAGATWTVATTVPWIAVPGVAQQGSQILALPVNATTLGVGDHVARVTIANVQFPSQQFTVDLMARVRAPVFAVSTGTVIIGGPDGLDSAPQPFTATLDTGTNAYPWTLQLADSQGLGWLTSSAASGTASGNQSASVSLGFDRSKVVPGVYTGTARFDAVVKGVTLSASAPITLKLESQRLFPEYEGVALSSFPGRDTLTRSIEVTASSGRAGVPWNAAADQSWLSVTPSGVSGDSLELTADPTALQQDTQHVAVVTLSSSDPAIANAHVRVGMWVGSAAPVDVLADPVELFPGGLVANPVEALAYSVRHGDAIRVYNVYSGELVDTFTLGDFVELTGIGVSGDGRLLFASDFEDGRTRVLDAVTGAVVTTYPAAFPGDAPDPGFIYTRPSGHPIVFTTIGEVFDLDTHTRVGGGHSTQRVASRDGKWVVFAQSQVRLYAQRFSKITAAPWALTEVETTPQIQGLTGRDLAIAASGERVFVTTSSGFKRFQITPTALMPLPDVVLGTYPEALEAAWNGRVYVGLAMHDNEPDDNLLIFDDLGNSLGSAKSGPNVGGRFAGDLTFSGDLTRVMSTHVVLAPTPGGSPTHYVVSFYNLPP